MLLVRPQMLVQSHETQIRADASFTLAAASDPAPIVVLTIRVYARQPSTQRSNVSAQHVGQTDAIQLESAESSRVLAEPAGEESQPAAPLTRDALEDIQEGAVKDTKDALNAVKNMHLLDEWNGTLENMQWLMDMVKGLADVRGQISLFYNPLSSF